jgi:nucleoside phosphorylase
MKILVTFAVDWEFKPWMSQSSFRPVLGKEHVFQTRVAGGDVRAIVTGVGPLASARLVRTVVDEVPDLCIVSGLTGGLKREYRPGDVLVARGTRSEAGGESLESDKRLFGVAVECGAKAVDQFVSVDRVVRTAKRKSELRSFADAVDMESFVIMKEMDRLAVPCVAVRSVADSAETDVPCDFDRALDAFGRIRMMHVLGQTIRDPRLAWPLVRFGVQSIRAASSLARYLDNYTTFLIAHQERLEFNVHQISR